MKTEETRTNRELVQILYDNLDEYFEEGLCYTVGDLFSKKIINSYEYEKLSKYLKKHKPAHATSYGCIYYPYWWQPNDIKPRREFLAERLKKLSHWWNRL